LVAICAVGALGTGFVMALHSTHMMQRMVLTNLLASFALFAGITALSELRYFDVASGNQLKFWLLGQAGFLALAVCSPYVVGELRAVSLLAWLTVLASVSLIARRSRFDSGPRDVLGR